VGEGSDSMLAEDETFEDASVRAEQVRRKWIGHVD
jgi:hypothetical protein